MCVGLCGVSFGFMLMSLVQCGLVPEVAGAFHMQQRQLIEPCAAVQHRKLVELTLVLHMFAYHQ
jgi:hypothetical protein